MLPITGADRVVDDVVQPGPPLEAGPAGPAVVAQALARLDGLSATPVGAHVEVFDSVHRLLRDALATLDEA